jgi:hypothetical protein
MYQAVRVQLCADGILANTPQERVDEGLRRLRHVQLLPGSQDDRTQVIDTVVMPVLYGAETALYSATQLGDLRRAACEAVRRRTVSYVDSIEIWATMCTRGHTVDAVQYLVYNIVCGWVRWLSRLTPGDDFDLLIQVHSRLHLREPLERRGVGGAIIPTVKEANGTTLGAAALLYEILRSLGWQWPSARTFRDDGGDDFTFPVDAEHNGRFRHRLREALRQREANDTQSPHRRRRRRLLPPRANLDGVQLGIQWKTSRDMLRQLGPIDAGILSTILCDGILTRERLFRHRGDRYAEITAHCLMPGCSCPAETPLHRYWHCPAHEALRMPAFRTARDLLARLRPCEYNCGIATISLPEAVDIREIQRVMVNIDRSTRLRRRRRRPSTTVSHAQHRGPRHDTHDDD